MEHETADREPHDLLAMNNDDCMQSTEHDGMYTNAIIHVLTTFADMSNEHDTDNDDLHKLLHMAKFSDDELARAEHMLTQIVLNNEVVCGGCMG